MSSHLLEALQCTGNGIDLKVGRIGSTERGVVAEQNEGASVGQRLGSERVPLHDQNTQRATAELSNFPSKLEAHQA